MHVYLSPWVEPVAHWDAYRPAVADALSDAGHGYGAVDLRVDAGQVDGWCLVGSDGRVDVPGVVYLGDDPDDQTRASRLALDTRLGVTLPAGSLRRLVRELLLVEADDRPPGQRTRWGRLRPNLRRGLYEICLGGRVWDTFPVVSGGAVFTDDFNRPDETPVTGWDVILNSPFSLEAGRIKPDLSGRVSDARPAGFVTDTDDNYAQADGAWDIVTADTWWGVTCRGHATNPDGYIATVVKDSTTVPGPGTFIIYKSIGGAYVELASAATTTAAAWSGRAEASGSSITAKWTPAGGSEETLNVTDTDLVTGGRVAVTSFRRVWWDNFEGGDLGGAGAQTVELNHHSAATTIHQQTVSPGATTVALAHVDAAPSTHEASITTGALTVALAHLDASPTVHQASASVGTQAIELEHVPAVEVLLDESGDPILDEDGNQLYSEGFGAVIWSPAVALSAALVVATAHLDAAPTVHQQTVVPGAVTVELAHLDVSAAVHEATVGQTVALAHLDAAPTLHQPAVALVVAIAHLDASPVVHEAAASPGAATVALDYLDAAPAVHEASVLAGGAVVELVHIDASPTVHAAAVTAGATTVALDHLDASPAFHEAMVTVGGSVVEADHLDAAPAIHQQAVAVGATNVALDHVDASPIVHLAGVAFVVVTAHLDVAPTIHEAGAAVGAAVIEAAHVDASPGIHEATVTTGAVTVEANHLDVAATVHEASVDVSAPTITLDHLDASPTFHLASVAGGAVTVELAHLAAAAVIYTATVATFVLAERASHERPDAIFAHERLDATSTHRRPDASHGNRRFSTL